MNRVTINDVARAANVSKTTISHYLNGHFTAMSLETKERISLAIEELNYHPNAVAKSLKNKKTRTIGIIVANILHSFSTQIIRAIEDYAHREDYHVIVCNADNDPVKERNYIQMLMAKQVDGIVAIPTRDNVSLFSKLSEGCYPVVFVDRLLEDVQIPSFMLDNKTAIKHAFEHLTDKGHREIGFVSQPVSAIAPRKERRDMYRELCEKNDTAIYEISEELAVMEKSLSQCIQAGTLPASLIVSNDLALFEVLKVIKKHGLHIPQDISIISIDDIEFAGFFNPAITVVAQPAFKIGAEAAQTLFSIIDGEYYETETRRFIPELMERESVKDYGNE